MTHLVALVLLCVAASAAACGRTEPPPQEAPADLPLALRVEPLAAPVDGDSGQAQLTSSPGGVVLSWLERTDTSATLKFSELVAGAWSNARTVATGNDWFITEADVPTVMRMSNGTLVAATYPAVDPAIEAYDIRLTYSRDGGATWSRPLTPHHDGTKTQHGFASLFEMRDRSLGLVWLDGRSSAMSLFFASFDSTWAQTAETSIDARVCECCPTAVVVTADGPLVAFRDRTPAEVRDIQVTRLEQGAWTAPTPVHADNWRVEACPVNGPALSARGRAVAAAWFTAAGNDGQAYAAFSSDAGRTWGDRIRLDDGASLGRVDVELLDDGSAAATWVEFADGRARLQLRRVTPTGGRSTAVVLAGADERRLRGYPRLAAAGRDLVLAWMESGDGPGPQRVRTAVARLN